MNLPSYPPVEPGVAEQLTLNWREFYADATGTAPEDAFRGFKIPLEDLLKIVEIAQKDAKINAVRAYLALGRELENGQVPGSQDIHILLVPVAENGGTGKDILQVPEVIDSKTVMVSSIYDFTTPCPAQCDFTSPLYSIDKKQTSEV